VKHAIPSLTDSYESRLTSQAFDVSASQAFRIKRGDVKKEEEEKKSKRGNMYYLLTTIITDQICFTLKEHPTVNEV